MLAGFKLDVITPERDLGIIIENSLKMSAQCAVAKKKADSALGMIRKGTENKTASIIPAFYKSVRHLYF